MFLNKSVTTMLGLRISSALCATILAAFMPQTVTAQHGEQIEPRRLDVMIGNSDEYAQTKVSIRAPERPVAISYKDHAKITSILSTTKEMINTANLLIENKKTFQEGTVMMEEANAMFREATGHIAQRMLLVDEDHMVRRKYSEHDIQQAKESEERALDVARNIFEVVSHAASSIYANFIHAHISSFTPYCILRVSHSQNALKCSYRIAWKRSMAQLEI
jgi:hypothetical protein